MDAVDHICASTLIGCLQSASFLPKWGENLWHLYSADNAVIVNEKYIKADTIRGRCDQYEYYKFGELDVGPYRMIEDCDGHCVPEHFFYQYAEQDGVCFQGSKDVLEQGGFNGSGTWPTSDGYGWSLWKYLNETDKKVRVSGGSYECLGGEGDNCYPGDWADGVCETDEDEAAYFYDDGDYLWMAEDLSSLYDNYDGGGNGQYEPKQFEYLAAYSDSEGGENWQVNIYPVEAETFKTQTIASQMGCYVPNFDCVFHYV